MKLNKGPDGFLYEATLQDGEEIVVFPGATIPSWYQSNDSKKEEQRTYAYLLFRNSKNVYKITNEDFEQLKDDEFESEQDLVDKLLVAKI